MQVTCEKLYGVQKVSVFAKLLKSYLLGLGTCDAEHWVSTCAENLEISGILTALWEMSGILLIIIIVIIFF